MMRHRRADNGAASLEYTGSVVIVGTLVLAVSAAFLGITPAVGPTVRWALCEIFTLGQGGCQRPSDIADPHVPTKPCVIRSTSTSVSRDVSIVVVTTSNNNRYEVAELSDGRFRVTELKGGAVGAEAGVGGGVSVTYNDQEYGASVGADVGAALQLQAGRTWYTDSESEAGRLISNLQGDAIEDNVTGPATRPIYDVGRWLVDRATGHDSGYPPPDEFAVEGGITLNAGAGAQGILASGSASAGATTLLGARGTRDGHTTVYVKTELSAAAAAQYLNTTQVSFDPKGAQTNGTITLITALTIDSSGALTEVTATAAPSGQATGVVTALFNGSGDAAFDNQKGAGVVYQASLPIRSAADGAVASQYFAAAGIAQIEIGTLGTVTLAPPATVVTDLARATSQFISATRDRGVVTRQSFTDNSGGLGVRAEAKLGIEIGAGASIDTLTRQGTVAAFWDGATWKDWTECA